MELNKKALEAAWDYQAKKDKLAMDLQTRVLTEEEMQEVMQHGVDLFIRPMVCYRSEDKQKEFNEAICQQYRLRAIQHNPHPNNETLD